MNIKGGLYLLLSWVASDRCTRGLGKRFVVGRVLVVVASVVCAAFWTAAGIAAAEGSTTLSANVAEVIEVLTWPDEVYSLGDLMPGEEITIGPLQFEVRSNVSWEIFIASDSPNGELREYDTAGQSYLMSGAQTQNPLRWRWGESGVWTPLSQTPASLFGIQPATGDASKTFAFFLSFLPSFNDIRLTDPNREYRIVLTYTVGARY